MDEQAADALGRLLQARCPPSVVREIERGGSEHALWDALEASGFVDAMVGEEHGGSGLSLSGAFSLMELCGAFALPVPLAETMVARALLLRAGVARPEGSVTFAEASADAEDHIVCSNVPGGALARWVLVTRSAEHLLLPVALASTSSAITPLAATLRWPASVEAKAQRVPGGHDVRTLQACIYSAQLAGALKSVFERTLEFANVRSQFGRPIGKFQAIQHQLSIIAEATCAARMAARIGFLCERDTPDRIRVAVAKARTSEAALQVASLSHAIHGAIGFTAEFDLQLFTRRLHLWRQAGGSESYWHRVAGAELVDGHDGSTLEMIRHTTDLH